jgi:hypothetical protein
MKERGKMFTNCLCPNIVLNLKIAVAINQSIQGMKLNFQTLERRHCAFTHPMPL